jgi:type I restriction enzyme S subunit
MQIIRELEIPLPPLAVQRQFEDEMRLVARETKVMAASLAELDALFASLQHRAFRGEL